MRSIFENHETLFGDLERFGDRTCLLDKSGRTLSFAEVIGAADDLYRGCEASTPALAFIHAANDIESVIAYVGAVRAGFAVHLLNPNKSDDNANLIERYRPEVLVKPGHAIDTSTVGSSVRPHPDLALLLATSGSTGTPKFVKLSRQNILSNTRSIRRYLSLTSADRGVTNLSPFYSYGLSIINTHLEVGASLFFTDTLFEEPSFWQDIQRYGVTNFAGVPYNFERIAQMGIDFAACPQLRMMTQAGGKLSPELVEEFASSGARDGFEFFVMYGQTEAAPRMSYLPPDVAAAKPRSIGIPIPDGKMWLVDEEGRSIAEPGVEGELVYAGPNVMCGYATQRSELVELEPLKNLHTGDLAEFDEDGFFSIKGRTSRFVKPYGLRVSLDDVEQMVRSEYPESAVLGDDNRIIVAIAEAQFRDSELASTLTDKYQLPPGAFQIERVGALPRLPNGKTDYRSLDKRCRVSQSQPGLFRAFASEFWNILSDANPRPDSALNAYRMVLGGRITGGECSFRSAGGDSLKMIQLQLLLEQYVANLPDDWPEMSIEQVEKLRTGTLF